MSEKKATRQTRVQFTTRRLFALVLVAAVGIVVWQRYFYVHPAHKNSSYEKAPYSTSGQARVGPNQITISSIARSDRNGSLVIEDRKGKRVNTQVRNAKVLKSSGSWLDTVQLELSTNPGDIEVLELRVFDHETRQSITQDNRLSYRVVDSKTLHLYGFGAKLPDRVDVWMRLMSYDPSDTIVRLTPEEGATCNVRGGKVSVAQLVEGYASYSSQTGLVKGKPSTTNFSLMLEYDGPDWPRESWHQITTVTKDGIRIVDDHGIRFPGAYNARSLHNGFVGVSEVDHFEIRPHGGRQRFFFEGVSLPQTSQGKFKKPPSVTWSVGGKEQSIEFQELAPISVRLSSHRGHYATGIRSNGEHTRLDENPKRPETLETDSTIAFHFDGVASKHWNATVFDTLGKPQTVRDGGSAGGWGTSTGYHTFKQPLENIGKVQLSFP